LKKRKGQGKGRRIGPVRKAFVFANRVITPPLFLAGPGLFAAGLPGMAIGTAAGGAAAVGSLADPLPQRALPLKRTPYLGQSILGAIYGAGASGLAAQAYGLRKIKRAVGGKITSQNARPAQLLLTRYVKRSAGRGALLGAAAGLTYEAGKRTVLGVKKGRRRKQLSRYVMGSDR